MTKPRAKAAAPKRRARARKDAPPTRILVIDVGGTSVKLLATGQTEPVQIPSDKSLTPARLVGLVSEAVSGWDFDAISIGYPGIVGAQGPRSEPGNLGSGWVGFNFAAAFDRPVRITNDAAMQALGSYEGGRMLFLGLGTGVGSAFIAQNVIVPLELGGLPWRRGRQLWEVLGRDGLKRAGRSAWRKELLAVLKKLTGAFSVDYVVLGGGNAKHLKRPVPGIHISNNLAAFRGGFRLWNLPDVPTLSAEGETAAEPVSTDWRVV
jgi:predicted NBD/HSP70 family sugar kinase